MMVSVFLYAYSTLNVRTYNRKSNNSSRGPLNSSQELVKETGRTYDKRMNWDDTDDRTIKICLNTQKSGDDLRFSVSQTTMKNHLLELV